MRENNAEEVSLALRARDGEEEAFARLVEHYQAAVHNLCYRMLGNLEAAEDASQETFLRVFRYLHRFDPQRPLSTWVLSIAAHYCIDRLRRERFRSVSLEAEDQDGRTHELPDPSSPNPEAEAVLREERQRVQSLLDQLDGVDRAAVVMRYWNDFSEAEIAQALHLTVSAVKSRLHRARRAMAARWEGATATARRERRPNESPAI
jgi:RNA polymerase sigma-70 factor (ECF subfamily)